MIYVYMKTGKRTKLLIIVSPKVTTKKMARYFMVFFKKLVALSLFDAGDWVQYG